MEKHVQIFLNKLSFVGIAIATFALIIVVLQTPTSCIRPPTFTNPKLKRDFLKSSFPKSTCDYNHRPFTSLEHLNKRLWSSKAWAHTVGSYTALFSSLQAQSSAHNLDRLSNHSRVLIASAGAGHPVVALNNMGISDVTGVDVLEFRPLVSRCDVHNLPFFDDVFDFAFSGYVDRALFPPRYVAEMERTVRSGGACVVALDACGDEEVKEIVKLFRKSRFLDAQNVSITGELKTRIVMRVEKMR